jgi:hypothetical protein
MAAATNYGMADLARNITGFIGATECKETLSKTWSIML